LSDIAIRFDGLLLGAVMLAGALIFALIAAGALIRILFARPAGTRSRAVLRCSAWLAAMHALGLAGLIAFVSAFGTPQTGPDWLDWLAAPWLIFTALGLVLVFRSRSRRQAG